MILIAYSRKQNVTVLSCYPILTSCFKVKISQSTNFAILVDGIECNRYKEGNTGPSYSCNKIGQEVTIRRLVTSIFSVCNISVYQGEYCIFTYHPFTTDISCQKVKRLWSLDLITLMKP